MTRWTTLLATLLLLASCALARAATVTLTWEAPLLTPDQAPIDGYVVARRASPSAPALELARLPATVLTYEDHPAEPGTYTYVVRALRGELTSDASNEASVLLPMPPPAALHATLTLDPPARVAPPGPYPLRPVGALTATADSQEAYTAASLAVDGLPTTGWHTAYHTPVPPLPHTLTLDLGATMWVEGLRYLPRQDGVLNGTVTHYRVTVSTDGTAWSPTASGGPWASDHTEKQTRFPAVQARYVRLTALAGVGPWTSAAEVGVYAVEATP